MAVTRPLIEVRNAAFRYGDREIFSNVDLDVYAGEVLTILGPNGCGKSTLLRCLGGALALERGSVRIGDQSLSDLDPRARARKVGFLFQDHAPAFPFKALDVVTMGRTPYLGFFEVPAPGDEVLAEEALCTVGIQHLRDRPYTQLSGGERQLVLLARTLVQEADVMLLDEPTSHLDLKNQVQCLKTIGDLATQGATLVMTTHDPNHAFLFPGRVVLIKPDRSILAGAAAEVLTEATLSMLYGTRIGVFSVAGNAGHGLRTICSPW